MQTLSASVPCRSFPRPAVRLRNMNFSSISGQVWNRRKIGGSSSTSCSTLQTALSSSSSCITWSKLMWQNDLRLCKEGTSLLSSQGKPVHLSRRRSHTWTSLCFGNMSAAVWRARCKGETKTASGAFKSASSSTILDIVVAVIPACSCPLADNGASFNPSSVNTDLLAISKASLFTSSLGKSLFARVARASCKADFSAMLCKASP
mmetsp:Transcript_47273/g.103093  ORF Transcript_47273/g.103093 Transcript_47273/m.103093 type:complete len:205 (+) Transcript_47273:95-709(+)